MFKSQMQAQSSNEDIWAHHPTIITVTDDFPLTPSVRGGTNMPVKKRSSKNSRILSSSEMRQKYPNKIPVVLERYKKEKSLPNLDRIKFLIPDDMSMSQFVLTIRNRLKVSSYQSFYMMVNNNKTMVTMSRQMGEVYREHKDEDGFLYATYASQEMYGFEPTNDYVQEDKEEGNQ